MRITATNEIFACQTILIFRYRFTFCWGGEGYCQRKEGAYKTTNGSTNDVFTYLEKIRKSINVVTFTSQSSYKLAINTNEPYNTGEWLLIEALQKPEAIRTFCNAFLCPAFQYQPSLHPHQPGYHQ